MRISYYNSGCLEITKHMLQCPLLAHPCTLDDLLKFNENARKCVDKWKNVIDDTKEEDYFMITVLECLTNLFTCDSASYSYDVI